MREFFYKACIGTLSCDCSLPIYRHLKYKFFTKTIILMFKSINIYRSYVYDPLGLYMSLVNNSIDPITSSWLTFINYLHQHIDKLIIDQFNPFDKLTF